MVIAAEPQERCVRLGRGRLRAVLAALVMIVLTVVLSATAFYTVCTDFSSYDDTGYFMLTQRTLAAGHPLYDQTFTQYGPAYYAWEQFLHTVTRLPLSHDSTLLLTVFSLITTALLCAGYVARLARDLFLAAFTFLAVATLLLVMKCEPGHPQELCVLLLAGMLLGASFLASGRNRAMILGLTGLLVGVLSMTKPNLGVFAAVAGAVCLSRMAPAGRLRSLLFALSATAAVVLPVALMRHNLPAVAGYCAIESATILLLVLHLAKWQPDQPLPWRVLAAALAGFALALVASAAYALAAGTTCAGLAHGLLLQHLGFDRVFSFYSPFANRDIILPLGVAACVWIASGPGRRLWKGCTWVPDVLKLAVAPFMAFAVLKLGITEAFIWCLPLVAATAGLSLRQPASTAELAPRCFALSLSVLNAMWGYPIWGSQAGLSFFLLIPVAIVSCADALRYGGWSAGGADAHPSGLSGSPGLTTQTPPAGVGWRRTAWMAISYAAAAGVLGVALAQADGAARACSRLEPSGLRGSRLLHMPADEAEFYQRLVQAARVHGRSFYTMPGLGSLYFWADENPPTCVNPTTWMTLLTPAQQSKVVEDLQRTPDLCVIRWNPLVEFWTRGHDIAQNKIARYIEDNFIIAESFNGCDVMVRRPAAGQTGARPGA